MTEYSDTSHEFALSLDRSDPLAEYRDRFVISDPDEIYLDGNSLGRLPKAAIPFLHQVVEEEWGTDLIRSWNSRWLDRQARAGELLAGILGAGKNEIVVTDSTSVNLFKLAAAALLATPGRDTIVSDVFNFPSDLYIIDGVIRLLGMKHRIKLAESADGLTIEPQSLATLLDRRTALVTLSHVAFKSAFMYDIRQITGLAHDAGALVLWDLSHSAGVIPVNLRETGVDMAVGCTYKYLNGGPGAPAYLYVSAQLQDRLQTPLQGWFGDARPFAFDPEFRPASGSRKFVPGTPGMLSLSALIPALELIGEAGVDRIRIKSMQQTGYLEFLFRKWLAPLGFGMGTSGNPHQRGSHIALRHPEAYRICQALIGPDTGATRVIPDFREPDIIRLGVAPLYTSFDDLHRAMLRLAEITKSGVFRKFSVKRDGVT